MSKWANVSLSRRKYLDNMTAHHVSQVSQLLGPLVDDDAIERKWTQEKRKKKRTVKPSVCCLRSCCCRHFKWVLTSSWKSVWKGRTQKRDTPRAPSTSQTLSPSFPFLLLPWWEMKRIPPSKRKTYKKKKRTPISLFGGLYTLKCIEERKEKKSDR